MPLPDICPITLEPINDPIRITSVNGNSIPFARLYERINILQYLNTTTNLIDPVSRTKIKLIDLADDLRQVHGISTETTLRDQIGVLNARLVTATSPLETDFLSNWPTSDYFSLPSAIFIPHSANLRAPYIKVLATGSLRFDACNLLEGINRDDQNNSHSFVNKTDNNTFIIFDLACYEGEHKTRRKNYAKNTNMVLFFGKYLSLFSHALERLGLPQGQIYGVGQEAQTHKIVPLLGQETLPSIQIKIQDYKSQTMRLLDNVMSQLSEQLLFEQPSGGRNRFRSIF